MMETESQQWGKNHLSCKDQDICTYNLGIEFKTHTNMLLLY